MNYYDPKKKIELITDASPVGLSGILTQENKVVAYASRALTDTESRYSQTEREALAIVWACEHFDIYLRGSPHFTVLTDHKPLERIWQKSKPPLRIERWGLRLQPFKLTIQYRPGSDNPSDYMSRHPTKELNQKPNLAEEYVRFVASEWILKAMTLDEVKQGTLNDKTLMKAIQFAKNGRWHEVKSINDREISAERLTALKSIKDELTVHNDTVLLREDKIVLPISLYAKAIKIGHEGHQGITRTKSLLRSKIWFPGMNEYVEKEIQNGMPCQATTKSQNRQPVNMSEMPSNAWQNLSADFCGPLPSGECMLVITDEYSRYPIVEIVKSVSASRAIPALDKVLSEFGVPKVIKTDNGSPFNSADFRQFAEYCGFVHRKITPRWPRANAQAESFNKPLMKCVKSAHVERKNWKQELYCFLRQYRATPHTSTGFTPYRLMFKREPNTRLPQVNKTQTERQVDEIARRNDEITKSKSKLYQDNRNNAKYHEIQVGDKVLLENEQVSKTQSKYIPNPFNVTATMGAMITATSENRSVTRNASSFKKVQPTLKAASEHRIDEKDQDDENVEEDEGVSENLVTPSTRPPRQRREPNYLKDFVRK